MAIRKEHKEFYKVDLNKGWEKLPGYPEGIEQQVLAGFLDEKAKRGFRTRHPTPAARPARRTGRSSRKPGACCWRCITTTKVRSAEARRWSLHG